MRWRGNFLSRCMQKSAIDIPHFLVGNSGAIFGDLEIQLA